MNMKAMIKSGDWLSDEHMYLAQAILQKQSDGWQSTLLVQIDGFIPATNLVSGNHLVTSSSLGHEVLSMIANYVGEN